MAMTKEMELDCLRDALSRIGQREKQIDAELRRLPQTSDAFTERRVEKAEILGLKRTAETRLNELLNPPPPDPRQKASIDALVKGTRGAVPPLHRALGAAGGASPSAHLADGVAVGPPLDHRGVLPLTLILEQIAVAAVFVFIGVAIVVF